MQLQDYNYNIVYRPGKDNVPCLDKAWRTKHYFLKEG